MMTTTEKTPVSDDEEEGPKCISSMMSCGRPACRRSSRTS